MAVYQTVSFGSLLTSGQGALVGYQLRNIDGNNNGSRINSGIQDLGNGDFSALVTAPSDFQGVIDWDTGGDNPTHDMAVLSLVPNSGSSQFLIVGFGPFMAGQTVGYQLRNVNGSDSGPHVTSGIVDFGYGYYTSTVTVPDNFSGTILWDTTEDATPVTSMYLLFGAPSTTTDPASFVIVSGQRLVNDSSAIVGSTVFLRHLESSIDGLTAFTAADATVYILQPDGTPYGGSVPVVVNPAATPYPTQELRAVWVPLMGGMHRVTWTFSVNDITIERVEWYFVAWTDVWATIRRRVRETQATMPDVDIDAEVSIVVRQIIDRFPTLRDAGGYAGLLGLDQERFDTAAGLLTAIGMGRFRAKNAPTGDILGIKLNQNEFKFADVNRRGKPLEQVWLEEAMISLGRVSAIQQVYASAAASYLPFMIGGPTRSRIAAGHTQTLMSSILGLFSDTWDDGLTIEQIVQI